jgi:hypothetical protein
MKPGAVLSVFLFTIVSTLGQGTVVFNNLSPNTNYRLRTNNAFGTSSNLMANSGNVYRIGLYVRPSTDTDYELVALTSNAGIAPGYFSGISPLALPAPYTNGQRIHFQIRAWSYNAGFSYEAALNAWASDPSSVQLGSSQPGITTLGGMGAPAGALFGTNEGQLSSGFTIGGCCPVFSQVHWVPHGLSTIAQPYDAWSLSIASLMSNAPNGTQIYRISGTSIYLPTNGVRWEVNQLQNGAWFNPGDIIHKQEAAFIRNPGAPFAITFAGPISPAHFLHAGANLMGFQRGGTFVPNPGDFLMRWNGSNYGPVHTYASGSGWSPFLYLPDIPTTEGVLYSRKIDGTPTPDLAPAVLFHNHIPAVQLDQPVTTTFGCVGTNLVAQLRASFNSQPFQDLGPSVPILPNGYLSSTTNLLRELNTGGVTQVRVRVWDKRFATYDAAVAASAVIGESPAFNVTTPLPFHPPSNLTNFISLVGPLSPFYVGSPNVTNMTALAGDPASFNFASSLGSQFGYTFQWQRTVPFDPTNPPPAFTWSNIPGATSAVYHIPQVQLADAGYYRVFMTYHCTNRASHEVYLHTIPYSFSQSAVRGPGNLLTFDIQSQAGLNYQLFSSVDLETWTPGPIYSNRPTHWSLSLTNGAGAREFFRLGVVP